MTETSPALDLTNVRFSWKRSSPVIDIESLTIAAGERIFLQGASGSGKSTLLSLIAGITPPQSGQVSVLGQDMSSLSAPLRDAFRAAHLGIIFQQFNLLPYLSLIDNVLLPCRFSAKRGQALGSSQGSWPDAARDLLDRLGLAEVARSGRAVSKLSVGQQQRVAAARALIGSPQFIIADEPTSALDASARGVFIDTLMKEVDRTGAALLFVSHDQSLGARFDRQISLHDINRAIVEGAA
ncbi:ABC transporter ATP-binding protein [Parvularcula sp. LCG005]|uniref:ABC transporter ATP-binding protein n=1 Tax=Parvularcula sp. LCG005 TaxID=3078805 RepID=UPI0029439912|nr:ABC transporter ATP-binding protein [Parvularcula sp. LCG005]WOI52624.1 ABC transporter ATP-binding protein [Parvularcula sp. LCG005]